MPLPLDDSWIGTDRSALRDGVRLRALPPDEGWRTRAPDLVTITWTCGWGDRLRYGEPGPVTAARMDAFEHGLTTMIEAQGTGRLMAVAAAGIRRTWYYYATDAGAVSRLIEHAINDGRTGSLNVTLRSDPDWSVWSELRARIALAVVTHVPDAPADDQRRKVSSVNSTRTDVATGLRQG
ncbi:MAG TPA: hypothetical protein PK970_06890 [Hyphomicrobiaceae bacterium]|nr:hypothetical protein [Hyphomicrobiaceae bacterium]